MSELEEVNLCLKYTTGAPGACPTLKAKETSHKATVAADKVAVAEEKARKAEEEATRVKAINCLAALHMPIDCAVKRPCPSAKIFEQHEAHQLSQASSMLVIKGE